MKKLLLCAFALALLDTGASAQLVTRVKATLVGLDGAIMTLQPLAAPGADSTPLTVTLLPETRFVAGNPANFSTIKPGDYAGAAVTEGRDGGLKAQQVYLYADALRGTGEGRFTNQDRLLVNGTVSKFEPTSPKDTASGTLTLHYRGAVLSPAGGKAGNARTICEGRAVPAPFASALACSADAVVEVSSGTPVTALTVGDKSLLIPGALVTMSVTKLAGRAVTPGLVIEKPAEKPVPMEKLHPTP